jgi:hypothetical protein
VDHDNNHRHDNRWTNLRLATRTQNNRNGVIRKSNKSGFKGVCFCKVMKRWKATITVDRRQFTIGYADEPQEAALLYDQAAIVHHGAFAKTNKQLGLLS